MANNYYDATGVLFLDRVTPVIHALFGPYALDPSHPGGGRIYIARISETNDPLWEHVAEGLKDLAVELDLTVPASDGDLLIEPLLRLLATHLKSDDNEDLETLIERHGFEDTADLDALFLLATCFDDGHNLTAISFEGCWHRSKPRLYEFGGDGEFISREVCLFGSSRDILTLASGLRQAVLEQQIEAATDLILREILNRLNGIQDAGFRTQLHQRLADRLFDQT